MTDDRETNQLLRHIKDWLGWCAFWLFLILVSSCASCEHLQEIEKHLGK